MKDKILDAGLKLWPDVNYSTVARALKLKSHTNVVYYFKSAQILKDAIAKHAVETGHSKVIVQLIATKHRAIASMPQAVRDQHLKSI